MARKFVDCREMPSESNCSMYFSGEEEHLLDTVVDHAVKAHGHEDTPELREQIAGGMKDEQVTVGVDA